MPRFVLLIAAILLLAACEPEVGSPEWCEKMANAEPGSLSMDDITLYAKNCVLK